MQLLNLFTILPFALAAAGETDDPLITKYPGLVSWFKSHGGIIDPRVTIGYDEKGIRGMISTDTIPKDTLIIQCPGDLVVRDKLESKDHCVSIKSVIEELNAGKESKWHKYFDFDDSSGSRIPSEWGTDMRGIAELQGLPPAGETHRHIDWYRSTCNNGRDLSDIEMQAFKIFITRAADIGLVPMYDLMNHHNGLINTYLRRTEDGKGLDVYALTDIAPNEQIYNTYARSGWESTVDVFNTYGFVEDYPQLWQWSDDELDAKYTANDNHHFTRYTGSEQTTDGGLDEPNSKKFEVLVLSDEMAALYPTKDLVKILGNGQRSMEEWKKLIEEHHSVLRESHVRDMQRSIQALFESFGTTIEHDEKILPKEKYLFDKVSKKGRVDMHKADVIQAIGYRLAFKKALKLAADVAEAGTFVTDSDEL